MISRTDIDDMTDAQDEAGVTPVERLARQLRNIVTDAETERDRYAHIAATIRVNALRGGATTEEVEAMVRGEMSFIDWLEDRLARPSQAGDERVARLIEAARNLVGHSDWGTVNYTDGRMWEDGEALRAALTAMDTPKGGAE